MRLTPVVKTSYSAILLLSVFATSLLAQAKKRPDLSGLDDAYEKRSFEDEDGRKLPYRLLKPPSIEKGKKYPLLVCLHGSGGCTTIFNHVSSCRNSSRQNPFEGIEIQLCRRRREGI